MKTGKSLIELATEIQRQAETKKDYIVSTKHMEVQVEETDAGRNTLQLNMGNQLKIGINSLAHEQIAANLDIPKRYYDRMRQEEPNLLADNINVWFNKYPTDRMVRTMDNSARAFLSNQFRPLENQDLMEATLPILADLKLDIMSCEVTERRLYIKAVDQRFKRDVPSGRKMGDGSNVFFDTLSPAIIISNSEVGFGNLSVEYGVFTKACTNLTTIAEKGMKKRHLGARHQVTENLSSLLSDETRKATDKAVWMQIKDVVRNIFDQNAFIETTDKISGMASDRIDQDPVKVIELTSKKFMMADTERTSVLKHLIEGGDLTRYGLFNAVTRTAQDLPDYDRATDFERIGGKLIDLTKSDWKALAYA
jgi:hypothetical protein